MHASTTADRGGGGGGGSWRLPPDETLQVGGDSKNNEVCSVQSSRVVFVGTDGNRLIYGYRKHTNSRRGCFKSRKLSKSLVNFLTFLVLIHTEDQAPTKFQMTLSLNVNVGNKPRDSYVSQCRVEG